MSSDTDMSKLSFTLIVFMFGFSSACAAFTGGNIVQQTYRTWRRSKNIHRHPFILMINAEWFSSVLISIVSFLFIDGIIPPGSVCSFLFPSCSLAAGWLCCDIGLSCIKRLLLICHNRFPVFFIIRTSLSPAVGPFFE